MLLSLTVTIGSLLTSTNTTLELAPRSRGIASPAPSWSNIGRNVLHKIKTRVSRAHSDNLVFRAKHYRSHIPGSTYQLWGNNNIIKRAQSLMRFATLHSETNSHLLTPTCHLKQLVLFNRRWQNKLPEGDPYWRVHFMWIWFKHTSVCVPALLRVNKF